MVRPDIGSTRRGNAGVDDPDGARQGRTGPTAGAPRPEPVLTADPAQHPGRVAAADIEHAGHQWIASRELALAPGRWGAEVANERGGRSRRLPDLVFWPACNGRLQVAVVVAQGLSNPRRERAAFEGWRDSIVAGRYAQVRYLAGPAAASHLRHLATDIGLTAPQLIAGEHVMADELPELFPIIENGDEESVAAETAPVAAPDFPDLQQRTLPRSVQHWRSP